MTTSPTIAASTAPGRGTNPSPAARGVNGRTAPSRTQPTTDASNPTTGRLRKNGVRRVRMTKTTRDWVASDSTNHAVWNRDSDAWNPHSIKANVPKSKIELSGPKKNM